MVSFIVLILAGAFVGAAGDSTLVGAAVGFVVAWVNQLSGKIKELQKQLKHQTQLWDDERLGKPIPEYSSAEPVHTSQTDWLNSKPDSQASEPKFDETASASTINILEPNGQVTGTVQSAINESSESSDPWSESPQPSKNQNSKEPSKPSIISKAFGFARDWFIGGNPFVRAGIVLLFIGVVFLLRYSLDRGLIPVELRLAGSAATALVLLFFGWRLRERAGSYGLILQAGGKPIMYHSNLN